MHQELIEGICSLLGWHKRVRWKKTETSWKIVGRNRKAYRELEGSDDVVGARKEFTEGIEKLAGNTPGDRQRKT
ncbi:hypothetical protein B296_00045392 [Ensete ventricosum]|uniref:Uncharacterized protein n=1 Tax=Ensete ventricosum TaxID=4639 RepID=A0A426XTN8_ENSVE|nr:hypothetical protein B296_00045392 [Ensete ventricosum]